MEYHKEASGWHCRLADIWAIYSKFLNFGMPYFQVPCQICSCSVLLREGIPDISEDSDVYSNAFKG